MDGNGSHWRHGVNRRVLLLLVGELKQQLLRRLAFNTIKVIDGSTYFARLYTVIAPCLIITEFWSHMQSPIHDH